MRQYVYYNYLGENGTVLTPVHIPGAYSIKKYMLAADDGKFLTKDGKNFVVTALIPESELSLWYEVGQE